MELKKVIAVRTAKTVYRDGDKAIKVFGDEYKKIRYFKRGLESGTC